MAKAATVYAALVLCALVVGGYMALAPHRPGPPYLVASLD